MGRVSEGKTEPAIEMQNQHRADNWRFLASVLVAPPSGEMLAAIARLEGDETALGQAYQRLAEAAKAADPVAVENEYFELFVGVGRGELLPYGSFYITGFLNERPLADLRRDLAIMGVERAADRHEPEDHIASVSEIMAGLAAGEFSVDALGCGSAGEAGFFARHMQPWLPQFFDDLAVAPSAKFFRHVAEIGSLFTDIESRAFELERKQDGSAPAAPRH